MRNQYLKIIGMAIAGLQIFSSSLLASNYADTYGISATGIAMGNAMTAHVDDWSAVYYNIAGLGKKPITNSGSDNEKSKLTHLELNYLYASPNFNIDIHRQDDLGPLPTHGDENLESSVAVAGLAIDINRTLFQVPDFISTARIGIAVGFSTDLKILRLNEVDPRTHNFLRYGREVERVIAYSGAGIGFLDDFFGVGVGVFFTADVSGNVMGDDVPIVLNEEIPLKAQLKGDVEASFLPLYGVYLQPGIKWPFLKGFCMGAAYRPESKVSLDPINMFVTSEVGNVHLEGSVQVLDFYQPQSFTYGISYIFMKNILLAMDYEIQKWSDFEISPASKDYYGESLPDLKDIGIFKLGTKIDITPKIAILGGVYFQPSFVSEKTAVSDINFLDNDKTVFSLGLKCISSAFLRCCKPFELTISYQMQQLKERTVLKTHPTGPNPDYSYGGTCHSVIFSVKY